MDSAPTVAEGVVYVGSSFFIIPIADWGFARALDAASGKLLWRYFTAGITSSPRIVQDVLYTGSLDGHIFQRSGGGQLLALKAANGRRLWYFDVESPIVATPTVANGVAYIGTEDGPLYAILIPEVD